MVAVNAGNANCATGQAGLDADRATIAFIFTAPLRLGYLIRPGRTMNELITDNCMENSVLTCAFLCTYFLSAGPSTAS